MKGSAATLSGLYPTTWQTWNVLPGVQNSRQLSGLMRIVSSPPRKGDSTQGGLDRWKQIK